MNFKLVTSISLVLVLVTISCVSAEYVNYKNYSVYKIVPETDKEVQVLNDLKDQNEYIFWIEGVTLGSKVRIMVAPEKNSSFKDFLSNAGMKPELVIEDIQGMIDDQMKRPNVTRNSQEYAWDYYQTLEEIYDWMAKIVEAHSDVASIIDIGSSIGGRYIRGVKIDFKKKDNPIIGVFEGGLHAREWITPATATWVINEFLTSSNPDVRAMAENVVWHIFPVTNPDGYVYSFTDNRMWRKNRNPAHFRSCADSNVADDLSNGIDLNRNFGFMWMTIGASSNPCTQTFAGPVAFSERESIAIANHITYLQTQGHLLYYFSLHSFSQMVLIPYSHLSGADVLQVPNYADMYEIAIRGMDKLKARHGTDYLVGTSKEILYAVGGSGFDWVKGGANVPLVFLFELRDLGEYGFLIPPEQIIPNNEETMDGLVEMDKVARAMGYYSSSAMIFRTSSVLMAAALLVLKFK